MGPTYVIELVNENFSRLPCVEAIETLIHELAHIPKTFSGALRTHNRYFRRELNAWIETLRKDSGLLDRLKSEVCPKLLDRVSTQAQA